MIEERARRIKLVVFDVDGVLTDGRIIYDNFGDELKFFDVHDGLALALLPYAGIKTAIVTAKKSNIVKKRARDASITYVFQNATDKGKCYDLLRKKLNLQNEDICCMGDDLLDIPMLKKAGLAVSVPNGADETKAAAHYVTQKRGGRGAVREIVEIILKSQGKWEKLTSRWIR